MRNHSNRRDFLHTAAAGATMGVLGSVPFAARAARAAGAEPAAAEVALPPEIEPLVQLLEDTPRDKLLEEVGLRVRQGLGYRELLAALQLAGVRNVQPRPSVGFKFHAVLVVNSAHLAALSAPIEDRWLPIFWSLDYFKDSQAQDQREGDWTMGPVDASKLPSPQKARAALVEALNRWNEQAADAAVAALWRSAGAAEILDLLNRYGARDFRSIGHKAIFVSNGQRTLASVGWRFAEPVLRSMVYAMLMHEDGNPAQRDDAADRPWRRNQKLAQTIRPGWQQGKLDAGATADLLAAFRNDTPEDAANAVLAALSGGVSPQSVWDAVFCGAGELLLRQPGIIALHSATTSNAIGFAFRTTADDLTRRLLLLQNASFLPLFRGSMQGRGNVRDDVRIDKLEPVQLDSRGHQAVEEILAEVSRDRRAAAGKVLSYLQNGGSPTELIDGARRVLCLKGNGAHDFKFTSAVLEDYWHVSPAWRDRFLAASVLLWCGSAEPDSPTVPRTRAALSG